MCMQAGIASHVLILRHRAGGDALASDLIWRELRVLAEKKPVIASMGDVAASGAALLFDCVQPCCFAPNW